MTNWLLTTDLHLTDKPQDAYRFELFRWLDAQVEENDVSALFILGDLTDLKDRHPSTLVNRVVDEIRGLASVVDVNILIGNHDYVDPSNPFFAFMDHTKNVRVFLSPAVVEMSDNGNILLLLPHTRNPMEEWAEFNFDKIDLDYIFMHQTVDGARASSGIKLEGMSLSIFKDHPARIFSGDIHVPQKLGRVVYVGSPYHIHFGDSFRPRVMLLNPDSGATDDLHFPCLQKHTLSIRSPEELLRLGDRVSSGDQVKIRLRLTRAEFVEWARLKEEVIVACEERGFQLFGIELEERVRAKLRDGDENKSLPSLSASPKDTFYQFCAREDVDDYVKEIGRGVMKGED